MNVPWRRLVGWPVLWPGILAAAGIGLFAYRIHPPAPDVAGKCATIVAALLMARLIAWVAASGHTFGREERLLAFVAFATVLLARVGVGEQIAEAAFDYQVRAQRAEVAETTRTLSIQILGFLDARRRVAPPPPRPSTWEQDVARVEEFETQTVAAYEEKFGMQVRSAHDLLTIRSLRDRELDLFYRRPANDFQIDVIARKLGFLARKLEEQGR